MLEPPVTPIRKANDGLELPATGFGTYKVNGLAGVDAIKSAIHQATDSSIPPSTMRMSVVGRAIRESGVPREDIIVTSKLPAATTPMTRRCSPLRRACAVWASTTSISI